MIVIGGGGGGGGGVMNRFLQCIGAHPAVIYLDLICAQSYMHEARH